MDRSQLPDAPQLGNLSETDKRELQAVLGAEMQKAKINDSVHNLTDTCWTKCITAPIKSGTLDRNEAACATNCVERFLDSTDRVLGHLQKLQNRMG